MRFLKKGGSNTNDADAEPDDVINPKTFYAKNGKQIGKIIANSTTKIGGLTYTHAPNNQNIIYDYNDKFKIAVTSTTDDQNFNIYNWENHALGALRTTINYSDVGIESGWTNDISIANIEHDENTAYIWVYTRNNSNFALGDKDAVLNAVIVKYNTVTGIYTHSNVYVNDHPIDKYTLYANGVIALNPSNNLIGIITYGGSYDGFFYRFLKYNIDTDNIVEILSSSIFGIKATGVCHWNSTGTLCAFQNYSDGNCNENGVVYKINDDFSEVTEVLPPLQPFASSTPCLPITVYNNYYILGNSLYDENKRLIKTYNFNADVNTFIWTYQNYLFVKDNGASKLSCYLIDEELDISLLYNIDVQDSIKSSRNYEGTTLRPSSNKNLCYADYDGDYYVFVPEDETVIINSLTRKSLTYHNTYLGTSTSDDILADKIAFSQGKKLVGTMPNNGELTYTPSDEEQTIPLGYTLEGKILPVDITKLTGYRMCIYVIQRILNNELLYKEPLYKYEKDILKFNDTEIDTKVPQTELIYGYTIITRIFPTDYSNNRGLFGFHGGDNEGIVGLQYDSGKILYGHGTLGINITVDQLPLNTWSVFTAKYDGSTLTCYVNGVKIGSLDTLNLKPLGNIIIGRTLNANNRYYAGRMSDFMIYNRPLDDTELEEIYNSFDETYADDVLKYTKLEYIESTGEQCIDTGIIPSNHKIEIKFQYTKNENNYAIFGTKENVFHLTWFSDTWYYACGNNDQHIESSPTLCTDLQTIIFNNDDNKITINGTEYGETNTSVNNGDQTLYLWKRPVGTAKNASAKIYYCKIWDKNTGTLVRDFIPVKTEFSDIGLYDLIFKRFYNNAGTNNFIAGNSI